MKSQNDQGEFARYRQIYEKNLEERFIHKNFEHPSPRFFINKAPNYFEDNGKVDE